MTAPTPGALDVVISGAGPAGVATAVALVRLQGHDPRRILVLDKARFPRAKPCGGGLTGHAFHAMKTLGLQLRVPSAPAGEGEVVFGRVRRTVTLGQPVHVVRSEDFDADLVAQGRALGIEIREGEGLHGFAVDQGRGQVQVATTSGQTFVARVLVGADGVASNVRRQLMAQGSWEKRQPLRLARLELPAPAGLPARMIYDFSPFTGGLRGYVWLFPVPGGRVNVGIMHYPVSELGGKGLDALLSACLAKYGVVLPGPARGWPAWTYQGDAPIAGPHVLCVGDAAGIDALTGEGIAVGLESGPLAAEAISRGLARGDLRFSGYRRALRQAVVGRELALDGRLARLLYGTRDNQRALAWLGLVFFDRRMLQLYAARVSGSEVLADRKLALLGTLARHLVLGRARTRQLLQESGEGGTLSSAA